MGFKCKKSHLGIETIKVRIYPNAENKYLLSNLFGQGRLVYNTMLEYKNTEYKKGNKKVGQKELSKYFHDILVKEKPFLKMFNTNIVKTEINNLMTAFERFYKKTSEKPKFKNKYDKQSIKFNANSSISRQNLDNGNISLTKNIKDIRFKASDRDTEFLLVHKKDIQHIVISKTTTDKYYAAFLFRTDDKKNTKIVPEPINDIIGLDMGINTFIVDSFGNEYENLRSFRTIEKKIAKLQRKLSKKPLIYKETTVIVNGKIKTTKEEIKSNNYNKLKKQIARLYEEARNIKLNYLHELTSKIVNENQVIVIEDLKVRNMMKNHKLAKAIQELSLFEFKRQLIYKAKQTGRKVVIINQYFPSTKKCNKCGKIKDISLSERTYTCECGHYMSRDHNAALNIRDEGIRLLKELGLWQPDFMLSESVVLETGSSVPVIYYTR